MGGRDRFVDEGVCLKPTFLRCLPARSARLGIRDIVAADKTYRAAMDDGSDLLAGKIFLALGLEMADKDLYVTDECDAPASAVFVDQGAETISKHASAPPVWPI